MGMTVAFTGHRPGKLPFSENDADILYLAFRHKLRRTIDRLIELGCDRFISGCAVGFDTWAAEDVINAKKENTWVRLWCAVPYPNQDEKWNLKDRNRRKRILDQSDSQIILSDRYTPTCFHKRNRYMVNMADVLVCCFDGSPGGTAYTVDYALSSDKIVIKIDPRTANVSFLSSKRL